MTRKPLSQKRGCAFDSSPFRGAKGRADEGIGPYEGKPGFLP